ncbi:MAG: GNAT family N-acetyltransferase [Armatimonadota bacterium]|nr:GNAT family N-acetyltransferase [Armatimonadota bacterium]
MLNLTPTLDTNPGTWIIRPALERDLDELVSMMAGQSPWLTLGFTPEMCRAVLSSGLEEIQVTVDEEDHPVGFLRWQPAAFLGQPYLQLLAVAPLHQQQGVGRTLLRWLEREVFEIRGLANLFLCVSNFNEMGQIFYRRLGYREVGRLDSFLKPGLDELIFQKSVRPLLPTV